MRIHSTHKARAAFFTQALAACALLLMSCATAPHAGAEFPQRDALRFFDPGALEYLRLSGPALKRFSPIIVPALNSKSAESALARASSASIAIYDSIQSSSVQDEQTAVLPRFEAIINGDFPAFWTRLSLRFSKGIKAQNGCFTDSASGIEIAVPVSGTVAAGSAEIGSLLERLAKDRENTVAGPVPERHVPLEDSGLFLYVPNAAKRLVPFLDEDASGLPLSALLAAARPLGGDSYSLSIVLLTADENTARIFRPIARLLWLGFSRSFFPDGAQELALPDFRQSGSDIIASDIPLKGSEIEAILRHFSSGNTN